ncbi:MAG: XisI protein [Cyanobacteria bacterium P01_G01_bin.54]
MDRLEQYRQYIQKILTEWEQKGSMFPDVEAEAIFDRERDRYQLVRVGWKNEENTRVYGCLLHVDIKNGKIWVQHDGGEEAIADRLVELGVPKQDIVVAYHPPSLRQYTAFAVG